MMWREDKSSVFQKKTGDNVNLRGYEATRIKYKFPFPPNPAPIRDSYIFPGRKSRLPEL